VYIHVKFSTFQFPLLQMAITDSHSSGHFSDEVLYHVTLVPSGTVHPHGKSQDEAPSGVHDAYS
jgi:hypothetical protein